MCIRDRVCTYAAITSIFDIEESDYTLVTLCADKEEVGSNGNTGMQSRFFENIVAELIELEGLSLIHICSIDG